MPMSMVPATVAPLYINNLATVIGDGIENGKKNALLAAPSAPETGAASFHAAALRPKLSRLTVEIITGDISLTLGQGAAIRPPTHASMHRTLALPRRPTRRTSLRQAVDEQLPSGTTQMPLLGAATQRSRSK